MLARQETPTSQSSFERQLLPEINSIFKYYSVENEVNFVADQLKKGVNFQSARSYLENSVFKFLGEFVAKVRVNKVYYRMQKGNIYFDGVAEPISASFKKLAVEKGLDSREAAEAEGFKKIEENFASGQSNIAFLISPPSVGQEGFGDYGFLFIFVKDDDNQIKDYILRYEGETENLKKSWQLYSKLISLYPLTNVGNRPISDTTEKGFLRDPLFTKLDGPEGFLSDIGFKNLSDFIDFSKKLDQEYLFREWLSEYIEYIFRATQEINPEQRKEMMGRAKQSLAGIYNLAEDIKNNHTRKRKNELVGDGRDYLSDRMVIIMRQDYLQKEAVVVGGGSCPVDTSNKKLPFQNGWESIMSDKGIVNYQSASSITSETDSHNDSMKCVKCPFCNKIVDAIVTDDKIICPKCNASVDRTSVSKAEPFV